MKKFLIALFVLVSLQLTAQMDGISYQAVIIGPDNQELPGVDAQGNILPNATISIRFTILDANNMLEYQEVQTTNTDQYGRINLLIGEIDPDGFALISWDGTNKDLKVEIDFSGGSSFVDMSREKLTFLPYAYHRNITATGTLNVDDATHLNGELTVDGPTNLNSILNVNNNNATNLSGELTVEGVTALKNSLNVTGVTILNDSLYVNNQVPSYLSGDLTVGKDLMVNEDLEVLGNAAFGGNTIFTNLEVSGTTNLNGVTTIDAATTINGRVMIKSTLNGSDDLIGSYPLLIEGANQGIAIKVVGNRSASNNFISFWDSSTTNGKMWGRIEGVSDSELLLSKEYIFGNITRVWDVRMALYDNVKAIWEIGLAASELVAASTSSTVCGGLGACVTAPVPSLIIVATVGLAFTIADGVVTVINTIAAGVELVVFNVEQWASIGVTYSSGSGDYAEWLPKQNIGEVFLSGELVGIRNGLVTKSLWGVEKIMVVSTKPIVLGNMPEQNDEKNNVKIAFMGQVPVKVLGNVNPGDYILPSELGSGLAKAIHPKDMKARDYKKVAGVAWSIIKEVTEDLSIVNIAVGINTNDLSDIVSQQEQELNELKVVYNQLKVQIQQSNTVLANLVPGYAEATGITKSTVVLKADDKITQNQRHIEKDIMYSNENDIIYFEISRAQVESSIEIAREQYQQMIDDSEQTKNLLIGNDPKLSKGMKDVVLIPIKDHPFWQKIDNNPAYKEEIILLMQSKIEKAYHTHKKYAHLFTDLKIEKN